MHEKKNQYQQSTHFLEPSKRRKAQTERAFYVQDEDFFYNQHERELVKLILLFLWFAYAMSKRYFVQPQAHKLQDSCIGNKEINKQTTHRLNKIYKLSSNCPSWT